MSQTTDSTVLPYKVLDCSEEEFERLAAFGRKEILLAENEMPGLMALREEFGRVSLDVGSVPNFGKGIENLSHTLLCFGHCVFPCEAEASELVPPNADVPKDAVLCCCVGLCPDG